MVVDSERSNIGHQVVEALRTSGFLLIQSDLLSQELQQQALQDATTWLTTSSRNDDHDDHHNANKEDTERDMVIHHPTDPKIYVMLENKHIQAETQAETEIQPQQQQQQLKQQCYLTPNLRQYWQVCEQLKLCVLRAIAVGLQLPNPELLAEWHSRGQHSAMRLLHYPTTASTATKNSGNRCKAHSDYGTVTLLSTDGVSGLEIYVNGKWWPVPHRPGTVVVNIGSLLSEWTANTTTTDNRIDNRNSKMQQPPALSPPPLPLLATLHRVAGPASEQSATDPKVLQEASTQPRTSIAFFVDPDNDTPLTGTGNTTTAPSIEDYLQYRSGGNSEYVERSGVAFTEMEQDLMDRHQSQLQP